MRQWTDFPLPDGSYSDDTRPWAQQDVCNFIPTFAEGSGTRSRVKYACAPGLHTFANVGVGPHRGSHDAEGRLYVVSGNTLYQISNQGFASPKGTIPGTGLVSMTHNQVDGGNQLLIGTRDNSYVLDTRTSVFTATGVALQSVDFLNQRCLGVDVARRFWRYSDLADATAWNTLNNESAESSPDRIVGLKVSQGEVLVFGERTTEVWANNPTEDTAFQRTVVIEKGCANANTIQRLDNSCFWLGNDGIAYRLNGYQAVPISPKALSTTFRKSDPARAFAFTMEDNGYVVYYLTFQDGQTWGYDVTSQKWHRRQSFGLNRWRLNTLVRVNNAWYAGDFSNGKLYKLTWGYAYEGCELMPRTIRSGVLHSSENRIRIHALRITADTGQDASVIGTETAPIITGALPDVQIDDVVSYQYTITRAYPQQDVTLTLSGSLPPGLTLDSEGLVTGTVTGGGTFSWTITASSSCATGTPLADSVVVPDDLGTAILDDAPILYWRLNETSGSTVTDYSGNARHGTTTGSPTKSSSGLTLTALAQGVYYPGNVSGSVLDVGSDTGWAIEAIVTRSAAGGSIYEWIAGQWRSPNFGYQNSSLAIAGTSTGADAGKPTGGMTDSVGLTVVPAVGPSVIATGTRTHLMIVRDPGTAGLGALRLYVDGVQVAANTSFSSAEVGTASNGAKFLVGSDADAGNYFPNSYGFLGKIEHVAVYATTISAARVHYHAHIAGLV